MEIRVFSFEHWELKNGNMVNQLSKIILIVHIKYTECFERACQTLMLICRYKERTCENHNII